MAANTKMLFAPDKQDQIRFTDAELIQQVTMKFADHKGYSWKKFIRYVRNKRVV